MNRSPVWIADVERFSSNLRAFAAAWRAHWPSTDVAYSYKTNRVVEFLHAAELAGAGAEVACEVEYELAVAVVEIDARKIVVDGPAK